MSGDRLEVSVTFDPAKGYVASAPDLRSPVVALSLGGCAPTATRSTTKVRYGDITSSSSFPMTIAQQQGYNAKQNVEVESQECALRSSMKMRTFPGLHRHHDDERNR